MVVFRDFFSMYYIFGTSFIYLHLYFWLLSKGVPAILRTPDKRARMSYMYDDGGAPILSVRLPHELEARLDRLCRETGKTRSRIVKEVLDRHLDGPVATGADPTAPTSAREDAKRHSGHTRIEARSLAMHRAIAGKVRKNPRLLEAAGENIRRWRRQGVDVTAFAEWEAILERGVEETVRVLTDPSENAARLRQSTPFTGVLTPKERRRFFEAPRS